MAKNPYDQRMQARDEHRELSRRALIKWTVAGAAALGLPRWKAFEILGASGGTALADSAACASTMRSVHVVGGNGGFAWFQLLWPHNAVAAAGSSTFAFHAPGKQVMATGTDKPLTLAPESPFKTIDGRKQITAFLAGRNETHTQTPASSSAIATGTSVFAAVAAMQSGNSTLIPVIAVDNAPFGTAAGAPRVARVPTPTDIVGLFNSVASRMGGLLEQEGDAGLFDASLKAMLGLQAAAATPATNRSYGTVKSASRLLGTNLNSQLAVSPADLTRYGVTGTTAKKLLDFANTLIITAKAFSLGLTSSVILPAFRDDPHGGFNNMTDLVNTVTTTGKILDAFYADLMSREDPTCAGTNLGDNIVMSFHGDTPKSPLQRGGWPDGTPANSNWTYVFGNGLLKTGWFGGINTDGTVTGWDPTTGGTSTMTSAQLAMPAAAAIAYAVARGDMRRVNDFYRGAAIDGVVRPKTM